jgi:hypothetical protein
MQPSQEAELPGPLTQNCMLHCGMLPQHLPLPLNMPASLHQNTHCCARCAGYGRH